MSWGVGGRAAGAALDTSDTKTDGAGIGRLGRGEGRDEAPGWRDGRWSAGARGAGACAALPGVGCGQRETEAEPAEELHRGERGMGAAMEVADTEEPFEGERQHGQ